MNKLFFPFSSDKYNLETKWWHRLLKILYFLVSIIILILSFFIIKEGFGNDLGNLNDNLLGVKQGNIPVGITNMVNSQTKPIIPPKQQSIIPIASADTNNRLSDEDITYMIKNGFSDEDIIKANDNFVKQSNNINQISDTEQPGIFKIFLFYSEITILTIISYLIINFIIQLFYYKGILYIVYGNNK